MVKTYKFESRAQTLRKADVRVVAEVADAEEASLLDELHNVGDGSQACMALRKRLKEYASSLPLLLYNAKQVVAALHEALPLVPKAGMRAIRVMSRELRGEFVSSFVDLLLPRIAEVCSDTNVLEEVFGEMSLCVKYLIKHLPPIDQLLPALVPYLSHSNEHVRRLSAQCFSYIVKKSKSVQCVPAFTGCDLSLLCYYACLGLHCARILAEIWANPELAYRVLLMLCFHSKYPEEVWDSCLEHKAERVLADWVRMCNYTRFPQEFDDRLNEFIVENRSLAVAQNWVRARPRYAPLLASIMVSGEPQALLEFLCVLSDFSDPHTEVSMHEWLISKPMPNPFVCLSFHASTDLVYDVISRALASGVEPGRTALGLLLWLRKRHIIDTRKVDIEPWLQLVSKPEDIWLALRASNELLLKVTILDSWRHISEEIVTEIAYHSYPDEITPATIPAAAKLGLQLPSALLVLPYLAHPVLRQPACRLIKDLSPGLTQCWEIASTPTDLSNERNKVLALKKLQIVAEPHSEAIVKALLGVFWERFTTLWKHVNECLAAYAPHNSEFLWRELKAGLTACDFALPQRFPLYDKLVDQPDFTPPGTYKECLLKFMAYCPAAVAPFTESFVGLFAQFVQDYVAHYFVVGFTTKAEAADLPAMIAAANRKTEKHPELNRRLTSFLKVIKELPDFSVVSEAQRRLIYDFCLQLLLKKVEEIRVLATDCLLKVQCEAVGSPEVLRGLAKDESFKSTALEYSGAATPAILFLCAGRAYRKCPFTAPAYTFLAGVADPEPLFRTLPLDIREAATAETLAACPIKRLSPLLRVVSAFAGRLSSVILPSLKGIMRFALSVLDFTEKNGEMYREVTRLALACISALLFHYEGDIDREDVRATISKLEKGIAGLQHEWRPRVMDYLHLLLSRYRWVLAERNDLLHGYIAALGSKHIDESRRAQGFALICNFARDLDCAPYLLPETDSITAALISKVKASGFNTGALELAQLLPVTPHLRDLADLLAPLSVKKPDIVELLACWLPHLPDYPLTFFMKSVPKQRRLLRILAALVNDPLASILRDLDAKTKTGLTEIDDFSVQLEALYRSFDLCESMNLADQKMLISSLSHFLVGTELAKRAQAAKTLIRLCPIADLWPDILAVLSLSLRRCKEDEELRTVLQVLQAYLDCTKLIPTTWGEFRMLESVAHLQVANRVKALKKLCELTIPSELETQVFSPLLTYLVFRFTDSKHNSQAYTHALLAALGYVAGHLPWKRFFGLLKVYAQRLTEAHDDKLLSRAVAGLFEALSPEASCLHQVSLSRTVLPALKAHIVDRQEMKSPHVRKYIVLAVFRYITKLHAGDQSSELSRLIILLAKFIRHRDTGTRESAIDCVTEMLKTGLLQEMVVHELEIHLSDDRELLAKAMTKVLIVLPHLEPKTAKVVSEVLLEYDQLQPFYYLAKLVQYADLPLILTSTKPLQFIAKGLSENSSITPLQLVELGLDLMTRSAMKPAPVSAKATRKDETFSVQYGAATGTRPETGQSKKVSYSDKVFAVRLIKQGIHKAKNVPESLAQRCVQACTEGVMHTADEIVTTSMEILRAFKSPEGIDRALTLGETSTGDMLIQSTKYLSAVLKVHKPTSTQEKRALILAGMGLDSELSQTSALKLLRVFMEKGTMDPAIYDTMEQIPKLMLTNSSLRDSAANLYIDFLRSYPLSEKRKEFHIDFLMRNLEFPVSTGRLAVTRAINLMLKELDTEGLAKQADFLMLALITALANEDDDECKKELEAALSRAMQLNPSSPVFSQVSNWVKQARESLQKAALVTLRLLIAIGKPADDLSAAVSFILAQESLSTDLRGLALSLLETALEAECVVPGQHLLTAVVRTIRESIGEQRPASLRCLELLGGCPVDLVQALLKYVAQSGNVLQHLESLILSAASEPLIVFSSSLLRKQLGRGDQGSGTLFVAHMLALLEKQLRISHTSLFKAVIIGSDLAKTEEMKQAVSAIFQELHSSMPSEEFLGVYNATKAKIETQRDAKKSALKQLMVSNPEA